MTRSGDSWTGWTRGLTGSRSCPAFHQSFSVSTRQASWTVLNCIASPLLDNYENENVYYVEQCLFGNKFEPRMKNGAQHGVLPQPPFT